MTASVSKQRVFTPTISTGGTVSKQRVFAPIHAPAGAGVAAQRVFAPIYYDAALASTRRRQVMTGSF